MPHPIKPMQLADLPQVFAIEQKVQASPWSMAAFESSLAAKDSAWVVQQSDEILAYAIVKPLLDAAELLTLAVSPTRQRQGIARELCQFLLREYPILFLEVRSKNTPAIALYETLGFQAISKRAKYYGDDDAIIFKYAAAQ